MKKNISRIALIFAFLGLFLSTTTAQISSFGFKKTPPNPYSKSLDTTMQNRNLFFIPSRDITQKKNLLYVPERDGKGQFKLLNEGEKQPLAQIAR